MDKYDPTFGGVLEIRTGSVTKPYVRTHLISPRSALIPNVVIDLVYRLCPENYDLLYLALIEYGLNMCKCIEVGITPSYSELDSRYLPDFNDKTVALYKYFRGWIRNAYFGKLLYI